MFVPWRAQGCCTVQTCDDTIDFGIDVEQVPGPVIAARGINRAGERRSRLSCQIHHRNWWRLHNRVEDCDMSEPKFEVPVELRNMAEKTIEQAEKAFDMFFDAANKIDGVDTVAYNGDVENRSFIGRTEYESGLQPRPGLGSCN
jgi:hypothetical protein